MKTLIAALWALTTGRGLKPWQSVRSIADLEVRKLQDAGVQALVFDVDNTLTLWHGAEIHPLVARKFENLKKHFTVVIFSNTSYSARHKDLHRIFPGIAVVPRELKKPGSEGFRRSAQLASCHPSAMVMIGDRLLTDVLGGNRAGMKTIKVKPFDGPDPWYSAIPRLLERVWA